MAALRALAYFVSEALTSLWRSRLINALSIGTIGVSLFVLGAFLALAANLSGVVDRWAQKVQVTFFLSDHSTPDQRERLLALLSADPGVQSAAFVGREEALQRFRELFSDLRTLPDDLGRTRSRPPSRSR